MKSSSGYEIYHNTLSSCLDEIERYVESKGYTLGDYFPEVNHVSYGTTARTSVEMLKNGNISNSLAVQIYRMDSGKYELNCYPVRKFALGGQAEAPKSGYTRPAIDMPISGVYKFSSKIGDFTLKVYNFERNDDTTDALEIQDELRPELGTIIIKNSAWKRLSKGLPIKAKTYRGNYNGTLIRLGSTKDIKFETGGTLDLFEDDEKYGQGGGLKLLKVGDKYLYKFDGIKYKILGIKDKQVAIVPLVGHKRNWIVSKAVLQKWVQSGMMQKIK
jgi:hypothetical protein